jgi:hypothetical protein
MIERAFRKIPEGKIEEASSRRICINALWTETGRFLTDDPVISAIKHHRRLESRL